MTANALNTIRLKNWKLFLLGLVLVGLFISLGRWQLSRAHQKEALFAAFAERTAHTPLSIVALQQTSDSRFYRAELTGTFDNNHSMLLDNKTYEGKVGYEVYTPFKPKDAQLTILVDRGFIPMGFSRQQLPPIHAINEQTTITGMLNLPPAYVSLGSIKNQTEATWPLRVEYINLLQLSNILRQPLYPNVLILSPHDPLAYATEWKITMMGPEKHRGYAVQWFAFALILLLLSVTLGIGRVKR